MSQVLGQDPAELRFSPSHTAPSVMAEAAWVHILKMSQMMNEANLQVF